MSVTEQLNLLRAMPLFEGVPDTALRIVMQSRRSRHFQAGAVILQQGQPGESLLLLTSGLVRVSRSNVVGHERVLSYLYAPAVLGETSVLTGSLRSATVVAMTETSVQQLFADELQMLGERAPRILWNLAGLLSRRITSLNDEMIAASISTQATMALVLLEMYHQRLQGGLERPEALPFQATDMTLRLGISRETVMRLLRRFSARGLVRLEGPRLLLLNIAVLKAIAHDLDGEESLNTAPD